MTEIKKSDIREIRAGEVELNDGSILLDGDYLILDLPPLIRIKPMISSWIKEINYDRQDEKLTVATQRGDDIIHVNVPMYSVYVLMFSQSLGKAYNDIIKGKYPRQPLATNGVAITN